MYEQLLRLDDVRINFSAQGMHAVNIVLAFVMFGVALGIRVQMFKDVLKHPKSALVGLFSQIIGLPAITFLIVILLNRWITPMVAMGMILVAACPGGNISNFMSQFSKANTELAISLTAVSTAVSTFITPLNFAVWGGFYVNFVNKRAANALQELHIDNFQMFETVFILLGIPLILGMLTAKYLPKIAEKLKKPMQYFSLLFFVAMVVIAFGNNLDLFVKYIFFVFILVFIHNGSALAMGYGLASAFKLPDKDRRTLTIETGIQNSGLGLVLLFNPKIFPPNLAIGGMLFITAWWGIWHIVSGLSISFYWSRKTPKQ
ncbi:MAG: bile acid:sodium symporter family protein [Dysgonamonadaceae bacterium]|jgi:BASS family bile acid:Na+ symporter|nr:bile acid:sodium symporter family protein [Dysgonamonadaceae bacterium]